MRPAGRLALACAALGLAPIMTVVDPASAGEMAVEIPGPRGPLRGTLLKPDRPAAAVVIIPGSGPTDRDGNNPLGVAASTYRLLAEDMATENIASLRIDKRGMFGSASAVADANAVTLADYAADIRGWARLLRDEAGTPCVWLMGHSEGGLVALVTADVADGICGLVLIATPGRPLGQVLRDQLTANPANALVLDQAFAAIAALEKGERVDVGHLHPALAPLFSPAVQSFLIDTFKRDPAKLAAAWKGSMLIVQGTRDLQESMEDARRLHEAAPGSTLLPVPGANHVLKAVASDDRAANIAAYANPRLPLVPGLAKSIADFIKAPHGR